MWILKFLPDWIFYAILLAGVAGLVASVVLKFIPFCKSVQTAYSSSRRCINSLWPVHVRRY
jgi:hypothetical protein